MSTALSPIVSEFATEELARRYDRWLRTKVKRVLITLGLPFHTIKRGLRCPGRWKRGRPEATPAALPLHRSPVRPGKLNKPSFCNAAALNGPASHRRRHRPDRRHGAVTPPEQIDAAVQAISDHLYIFTRGRMPGTRSQPCHIVFACQSLGPGTTQRPTDEKNVRAVPTGDGFGNGQYHTAT